MRIPVFGYDEKQMEICRISALSPERKMNERE